MLAETRNRGPRRDRPVSPAGHDQLGAGAKHDRRRRTLWVAQRLAAAGRTLRPGRHVMLHDGRAQQVEADDVIAQIGAEVGGDRFGDLDRCKLDGTVSKCVPGRAAKRQHGTRLGAVKQRLDLPIASHAIGKAGPTRALARAEHRTDEGKNAGWLHQQPRCAIRQVPSVQFGQPSLEIVVHQGDCEVGGALDDANT